MKRALAPGALALSPAFAEALRTVAVLADDLSPARLGQPIVAPHRLVLPARPPLPLQHSLRLTPGVHVAPRGPARASAVGGSR